MSGGKSVSMKVVEQIAEREGEDPADLHPPLHSVIDLEALESLFQPTRKSARKTGVVEFDYQEYKIKVDGTGDVEVHESVAP